MTDNSIIGLVSGAIGGILTKAFQYVPVIGEGLENVIAKENLVVTAVLGAICYLGYNSFKNIYHSLIKVIDKKIFLHNYRLDLALDSKLYYKENCSDLLQKKVKNSNKNSGIVINYIVNFLKNNIKRSCKNG